MGDVDDVNANTLSAEFASWLSTQVQQCQLMRDMRQELLTDIRDPTAVLSAQTIPITGDLKAGIRAQIDNIKKAPDPRYERRVSAFLRKQVPFCPLCCVISCVLVLTTPPPPCVSVHALALMLFIPM